MDTLIGKTLSHYRMVEKLGAGGMGEVYRARDTRLGRDVAIKVLPADLTATPEARARFEREARAISHLNHPNICTLHDVGREGKTDFLVMELITGGSLRDRLTRKPLPLDQVVDLGIQIGDALDAAHARGIVHRDLKPGNVLLTERGQAKVMDFGLATGFRRGAKASGVTSTGSVVTDDQHLTSPGQVIGTVAYMSPEQARGEEVDARSDVFSLGTVLYEMASGHRAFEGNSTAVIFEAILNRTPAPASMLREGVPAELDRIIGKALEKDPELRYQTAGEVRSDLKRLKRDLESSRTGARGGDSGSSARTGATVDLPASVLARRRLIRLAWATVACIAIAGAIFGAIRLGRREPAPIAQRLSLEAPKVLHPTSILGSPAISPDGRYIAFTAADSTAHEDADLKIWIQPMDGTAARPLPGTEGSRDPFWSPDSRFLGFVAGKKLKKIEVAGGEPVTICDRKMQEWSVGVGSWGKNGTILLDDIEIWAVNASGGQLVQVVWPDSSRGETECGLEAFLPDGKHFLYRAIVKNQPDSMALRVGCLGSRDSKILAIGRFWGARYAPPGYLLFVRVQTLLAQPFDVNRLRLTGEAFPVLDDVSRSGFAPPFSISDTGTLVYRSAEEAAPKSRLVWVDRVGREIGALGQAAKYFGGLSLSPDEKRVAVSLAAPGEMWPDIWVIDVARDMATRFSSDPGMDVLPVWSADGATLFYSGGGKIWSKPTNGIGEGSPLPLPPDIEPRGCVTPDNRFLLAARWPTLEKFASDIVTVSLDSTARVTSLGVWASQNPSFSLSPDGKWLAYGSAESGRDEVYVVDFPAVTGKWRVSRDGVVAFWGGFPRWSADGRELYFVDLSYRLMAAPISTVPSFQAGRPARILDGVPEIAEFAPTSDRNRFLVMVPAKGVGLPSTRVILNWPASLGRR